MTTASSEPTYDIVASAYVPSPPSEVYEVVSDITRMGEWSPECVGGEWLQGEPATVGAVFRGYNQSGATSWSADCEVVSAEPAARFAWKVLVPDGTDSTWSFDIEPDGAGSLLTQRYVLRGIPQGMRQIKDSLPAAKAATFVEDRRRGLQDAMRRTVTNIEATMRNHPRP